MAKNAICFYARDVFWLHKNVCFHPFYCNMTHLDKDRSIFGLHFCRGEACETICNHKQPGVKFAVVNGGIFSVWDDVAACLPTTRFVRHQNIFGIYIPGKCYDKTIRVLNLLATSKK